MSLFLLSGLRQLTLNQMAHNKLLHSDSVSCRGFCKKTQKRTPTYSAGEQGVQAVEKPL